MLFRNRLLDSSSSSSSLHSSDQAVEPPAKSLKEEVTSLQNQLNQKNLNLKRLVEQLADYQQELLSYKDDNIQLRNLNNYLLQLQLNKCDLLIWKVYNVLSFTSTVQ